MIKLLLTFFALLLAKYTFCQNAPEAIKVKVYVLTHESGVPLTLQDFAINPPDKYNILFIDYIIPKELYNNNIKDSLLNTRYAYINKADSLNCEKISITLKHGVGWRGIDGKDYWLEGLKKGKSK